MKILVFGDLLISEKKIPTIGDGLREIINKSDVNIVNLEGSVCRDGISGVKKIGPSLRQDCSVLDFLREAKFTHISLSNNHILDYGKIGLIDTIKSLGSYKYYGAGLNHAECYSPAIVSSEDRKIALFSFCEGQQGAAKCPEKIDAEGGYGWILHPLARQNILKAKEQGCYVIIQAHAGLEGASLPLPEWRDCYREFIDLGADVVIGHHPHVLQGYELYKRKPIFYSIGNFYMDKFLSENSVEFGACVEIEIDVNLKCNFVPLKITKESIEIDDSGDALEIFNQSSEIIKSNDDYLEKVNALCDEYWQCYYEKYYQLAINGFGISMSFRGFMSFIRRILSALRRGDPKVI